MIISALRKKYEADMAIAKANINIYLKNSAGIGDHSDIIETIDKEVTKLADAEDKLSSLQAHFGAVWPNEER